MITLQMVPEPVRGWRIYGYRFPDRDEYYGTMRCNPFVPEYYTLLEHGEPVLDIRQTSLKQVILLYLFKLFTRYGKCFPRYHVFSSKREIGESAAEFSWMGHTFVIQGDTYVLRQHSHNVGSLTKNGRQIARYRWKLILKPWWDQSELVEIEYLSESDERVVLTFALLFYGFFHVNDNSIYRVFFRDKDKHLAHWESQEAK